MTLADRLAAALSQHSPGDLLAGDLLETEAAEGDREAAVLVAITDRPQPGVLLTERRADLRLHAGQVAFPGGRIDPGETAREAALREAWEEIALDPAEVRIVAEADPYRTVTGFGVTPIVGVVPPDLPLPPTPAEVASLFEAPLAHLIDPANQLRREVEFHGRPRHYFEIVWEGRRIWGATAAMIVNLSRRLRWN